MTTMERLFVEIFDRKSRIERQLHQQFESYGESLAFNVIADGEPPPDWLWERAKGTAVHPHPRGLNKEQLISGIVFPFRMANVSLVNPDTSFIREVPSVDEPVGVDLINEGPKTSEQNHNRAVEARVIEDCSERDEMNRFSNSRSIQRDSEFNLSKKAKTTHLQGEDGASNRKIGIKTRSRTASEKKLDCVDSFVANTCADTRSGRGERVTRSRSILLANEFNSSDKSPGVNYFHHVKDISNLSTECQSQIEQLQNTELNKISSDKRDNAGIAPNYAFGVASVLDEMEFQKSSTLPDTISLVEREKSNVIHDCQENKNTSVEFPNESQSHSYDNAVSRPEAILAESEKTTWRQSMDMHVSPSQQVQQRDMLRDAEDISIVEDDSLAGGMEEDKEEFLVVEDLKHSPHFASSCEQPGLPFTSSALSPTRSVKLNSFVDKVASTVISRESSSGNSLSHSREEQLCGELKDASEDDAALCQDLVKSMLGGPDLQFHKLKESSCRKKSAAGSSQLSSKCACSYIVSEKSDNFLLLGEESLCNAHVSLLDIQPLEGDSLATAASLSGKEVGSGPVNCHVDREVSEVVDPTYNFNTTLNNYKPPDGHVSSSSELDFESSKHDSSPQFTYFPVSSCLRWSGDHISTLNISGNSASKVSSKCQKNLKSLENFSEGEKDRYRHSTHAHQSCLAASFPLQNRVLRKVNSQNFAAEAARSVNSSATGTNDASIPDKHSVGIVVDEAAGSIEVDISILPLSKSEDMLLSAQRTYGETSFLGVMDNIDRKTSIIAGNDIFQGRYFLRSSSPSVGNNAIVSSNSPVLLKSDSIHFEDNKVAICPDTAEKPMIEKALVSKPLIKVSDCEYEHSYPRRKKKYKYNNIIATSPRSRARSFLDSNQQNVCRYQTRSVLDAVVLQSPPKSCTIQIPTVQTPATEQNNKLHVLKDDSDFKSSIHDLVIAPNGLEKNKDLQVVEENLSGCSRHQVRPTNLMPSESEIHHTTRDAESLFSYVDPLGNRSSVSLGHHDESKEPYDAPQCLYRSDITCVSDTAGVNVNCDETMPEFERFNIELPYTLENSIIYKDDDIPSIAKERAFVLEKLRLSSIMPTPSSKPSLMNKINIVSSGFHSLPLGMHEKMDLVFPLKPNNPDIEHFTASSRIKLMDLCCNIGSQLDGLTLGRSQSLSSSSTWFGSELNNLPLTPPVRKFAHGRLSKKRSHSSATASSIPELTCFRIDENTSTIEENDDFVLVEHSSSRNLEISSNVNSLSDETGVYENTSSRSNSRELMVRDSLESVNSDSTCSHGFEFVGRESKVENKENPKHTNHTKKPQKATGKLSKIPSRLSSKSSESHGNYQNIRKGSKPSNIISSVSSFVPHIQQKQQGASRLQGVKNIKVKALEAAETAKRLEDQKKLEREKKKAATKLEREKIRQVNTKLLKLKQKQREEEKRKKEEYVAARKRQREEEERKIKERKRRCIEETRTLLRECEEKMHYDKDEKDLQQRPMDEKQNKRKQTSKGLRNLEKGGSNGSQIAAEVQHHTIQYASGTTNLCDDKIQAVGGSDEHNFEMGVVCPNIAREANEETPSAIQISPDLQSYDMSPYQNSDDEEREDSWRKKKYIPMWARRESLSEIILAVQHLDPKEIFSRKRSFDVSQVLPAHPLPQRPLR